MSAHFNVGNTVIHSDDIHIVHKGQCPSDSGSYAKWSAHARSLGIAYQSDVLHCYFGYGKGFLDESQDLLSMVVGCFFREEASSRGSDVGFSWVGYYCVGAVDYSDSYFIGGSLNA